MLLEQRELRAQWWLCWGLNLDLPISNPEPESLEPPLPINVGFKIKYTEKVPAALVAKYLHHHIVLLGDFV